MVYLNSIDSFTEAAQKLYKDDPVNTRYSMKFDRSGCNVVLRVTDDKTCVSYRTTEASDMRRVEKLNTLFLFMCAEKEYNEEEVEQHNQQKQQQQQAQSAAQKRKPQTQGQGKKKKK
eukprot:TRINITY_DN4796_c0_g1_i1.p1 TRINITY_DN4796_c0_g1~~TRINITY_DN4796_c0_g1_i1.p1  ORF type:complete len:117 (+),score=19.03 TRINITY_DN4796_c0_g1_i1:99-449(+)